MIDVTVALPVVDGAKTLPGVLEALARQSLAHELLACDSGSTDGSVALLRSYGARVIPLERHAFGHGRARNLLLGEARGAHVALLSQDAEPADDRWLEQLLGGFALAPNVGIAYGPYTPRAGASAAVRLELERWFCSLSVDGAPSVERLSEGERLMPALELLGRRGFFTDANACVARAAWERVPFRDVPYAEDRVLAVDMMRAGYAKVFVPDAAVLHSHDYTTLAELRRSFDEWRGLREVYGWREPASPAYLMRQMRGALGQARRELAGGGATRARAATLAAVARHHSARLTGAVLGSRADRVPTLVRRWLSLERRGTFVALDLDASVNARMAQEPHP